MPRRRAGGQQISNVDGRDIGIYLARNGANQCYRDAALVDSLNFISRCGPAQDKTRIGRNDTKDGRIVGTASKLYNTLSYG